MIPTLVTRFCSRDKNLPEAAGFLGAGCANECSEGRGLSLARLARRESVELSLLAGVDEPNHLLKGHTVKAETIQFESAPSVVRLQHDIYH